LVRVFRFPIQKYYLRAYWDRLKAESWIDYDIPKDA